MLIVWTFFFVAFATLPINNNGFQLDDSHFLTTAASTTTRRIVTTQVVSFQSPRQPLHPVKATTRSRGDVACFMSDSKKEGSPAGKISGEFLSSAASAAAEGEKQQRKNAQGGDDDSVVDDADNIEIGQAATGTVNERLLLELQEAAAKEKSGSGRRSSLGKKLGLDEGFRFGRKTDSERQAAIEEARDLNGVDPLVTAAGSVFALVCAFALWKATNVVGVFFALHPVESDAIFIQRTATVFRNVVVGLVSLASGFFGVTGLGILLLTFRVAYGVLTGELDPTPIKKAGKKAGNDNDALELPNVLDLMLNKRPKRRGSSSDNKDNFGL
jgi:Protein of unknown function (DUF3082)